jgi:hypothetical protein
MKSRFDRRKFLGALGVGGAFLPLLDADLAQGQAGGIPKRLLVVAWSNGYIMDAWRPSGGERDFKLGDILKPLEPFRDKLLVIDGLGQRIHYETDPGAAGWGKDQWYGGHDGYPAVLTAVPCSEYRENFQKSGGTSLDQYVASELAKHVSLPFQSLVVGPWSSGGYSGTVSYQGPSEGVTPEFDPFNLYRNLFEGRSLPMGEFDKLRAQRLSVLDYLGGSLESFKTRMGTEERAKIDAHLSTVREIERQLSGNVTLDCQTPAAAERFDVRDDVQNYPRALRLFSDLLLASFRCDLTRVASFMLTDAGGDNLVFSWLGDEFTGPGDEYPIRQYHDITHNAGRSADHTRRKIRVEQWFHEEIAYIAQQLQATPEGNGTMLDNTLIVITNSMGENHDSKIQPFTLIGNLNGYFETGRYLSYPVNGGMGAAHNGLLVAIANAMGVDPSGLDMIGPRTELDHLRA